MKPKAFQIAVLREYVVRAKGTGTMADAAIAADYMARITGKPYDGCINALVKYHGLRYAERVCKDRPGMYTAKNPGKDMLPVKFDRETISVTTVKHDLSASDLFALGI